MFDLNLSLSLHCGTSCARCSSRVAGKKIGTRGRSSWVGSIRAELAHVRDRELAGSRALRQELIELAEISSSPNFGELPKFHPSASGLSLEASGDGP